tara:strand:+ start:1668 stop:2033 length:366 start_codon:yes stop_codon:yes gene_type:complete
MYKYSEDQLIAHIYANIYALDGYSDMEKQAMFGAAQRVIIENAKKLMGNPQTMAKIQNKVIGTAANLQSKMADPAIMSALAGGSATQFATSAALKGIGSGIQNLAPGKLTSGLNTALGALT